VVEGKTQLKIVIAFQTLFRLLTQPSAFVI